MCREIAARAMPDLINPCPSVLTGLKPAQRQLDLLSDPSLKTKLQLPGDLEKSSMATDEIELWRE